MATANRIPQTYLFHAAAAAAPAGPYRLGFAANSYFGTQINVFGGTLPAGVTVVAGAMGSTYLVIQGTYPQMQAALASLTLTGGGATGAQDDTLQVNFMDGSGNTLLNANGNTAMDVKYVPASPVVVRAAGYQPPLAGSSQTGGYAPATTTVGTTTTTPTNATVATGNGVTAVVSRTPIRVADALDKRIGFNTFSGYDDQNSGYPPLTNSWGTAPSNYNSSMMVKCLNWLTGNDGNFPAGGAASGYDLRIREYHYQGTNVVLQQNWMKAINAGTYFPALNNIGTRFMICIGNGSPAVTDMVTTVQTLATAAPGGLPLISTVEPLNEPNLNNITTAQALAAAQAVSTGVVNLSGVQRLANSLVMGFPYPAGYLNAYMGGGSSNQGPTTQSAQFNALFDRTNMHYYPSDLADLDDGTNQGGQFAECVNAYNKLFPSNKILDITEYHPTYYDNHSDTSGKPVKFNDQVSSLRFAFDIFSMVKNYNIGVLYWFSFLDWGTGTDLAGLFGLAGVSQPKKQAYMLRNLLQLLGDTAANKHTFGVTPFTYSVTSLPGPINTASPNTGGQTFPMQRSDGVRFIVLANVQRFPSNNTTPVTITLGASATQIDEFDLTTNPAAGLTPVQTVTGTATLVSQLNTGVRIIRVTP